MAGKKKAGGKKKNANNDVAVRTTGGLILVDPARCRFQHSRIRPYFSGCGRSVYDTLEDIKCGTTKITDLPPIQVLVGPVEDHDNDGPWYFSLNNRRLWVMKRLREEGFLEKHGNKIAVRVRRPKSQQERERYTIHNCSLEARVMEEKKKETKIQQGGRWSSTTKTGQEEEEDNAGDTGSHSGNHSDGKDETNEAIETEKATPIQPQDLSSDSEFESDDDDDDDDSRSQEAVTTRNRFSTMIIDDDSSSDDND